MALDCLANTTKDYGIDMNTVTVWSEDDNDPVMSLFEQNKTSLPAAFHDDPVALSCAAYRTGSYPRFEHLIVSQPDRELAQQVRRHFMDKLVMQRLRGERMSAFREKLGAFLVDNRPLLEDEIGILYQLPYFYHEDLDVESLIADTDVVTPAQPQTCAITLRPYKTFNLKRRGGSVRQYWWIDQDRRPYCLPVKENETNQPLYQSIWNFSTIQVESHIYTKPFMGTDRFYYKLAGTKLLGVS